MKRFKWVAALVMAGCLLMMPEVALNAAREAMASWASSVAPALFPFMALMPLLTCDDAARAYEALLGRIVRPLFRLPGAAAPAVLTGMAAGSPAGAMAAVRVASASVLRRGQLERLVICIGGLSPAFLVSASARECWAAPPTGGYCFARSWAHSSSCCWRRGGCVRTAHPCRIAESTPRRA